MAEEATAGIRAMLTRILPILSGCALVLAGGLRSAAADSRDPREQAVDAAIVKALEFLAREQQPNGSWRVNSFGESTAATSLSVMAFLAAGHVPGEGQYGAQIERGVQWVLDHQQPNGMIVHKSSHGPMYSHGISTLMLAEVVGMLNEEQGRQCRKALERAIRLILDAQAVAKPAQHAGGWRYQSTSRDSDLSVTGWQLLALRAAKNIGCDVPIESIDRAVAYVKKCSVRENEGFAYQPNGGATAARTGTGILALEICGAHHSDEAVGAAEYLLKKPPEFRDHYFFYGAYYCGVGMFKMGGKYWDGIKPQLIDTLLENQAEDGSWTAKHGGERSAGPVYATCMAVLSLAVEYRYLPIYQR